MTNKIRLPNHIKPERYKLMVKPDLDGFVFEGVETIYLTIEKATNEIRLHAKELKVSEVSYKAFDLKHKPSKIFYDIKAETVTFFFKKSLPKSNGELSLKFRGILSNNMRGFYRSRYTHQGKEKHLATTQFEATDARRAFPCFDEPAQKAVFDVSVIIPKSLTAISNTVESSVLEHENGYKIVNFAPSPKMSTYLLAFIVGDFEYIEGYAKAHPKAENKKGTLVRVFVTPGKKHQAKFALDTAIRCLEFYNNYFDIPFPLPVLDLIAIPDFSHGAMENWGAVTYRESALLVDPEHSSASNKQWVALVIAHELAHQWFGNLVTMHWWTDLWLNEGFASYIEYLATDHLFPKWDIWTQFAYADLGVALRLDGLKNTHPIEIEVHHPDEIGEIFDEVSYSKGASVIRMLADFLGEKNFRDGLRYYLKKHAYSNTKTTDLWQAFEKVSKKPVTKIMGNWTKKPGYPLIKIIRKPRGIKLEQSRYYSSALSKKLEKDKTLWQIPVSYKKTGKTQKFLFSKKSADLSFLPDKINSGETGFYRVNYPLFMLKNITAGIKNKTLPPIDRLGVIRDAFAVSESQQISTVSALELALAYTNETDYTVWTEISQGISLVYQLIAAESYANLYEVYAKKIFRNEFLRLGWKPHNNERHTQGLLRSLILQNYGAFGGIEAVEKAKQLFKSGKISADLRGVVYNLTAKNGGKLEYKKFVEKYVKESLHEEKNRLGRGLASFRDPQILKKVLEFSLSKNVRPQDAPAMIAALIHNPYARQTAWQFVQKNWAQLNKRYPSSGHMLGRMIKPLGLMNKPTDLASLKKFFKKHKAPGMKRTIEQITEQIESNILWLKNQGLKIESWLKNEQK